MSFAFSRVRKEKTHSWFQKLGIGGVFLVGLVAMIFGVVMVYKTHFEHPQYSYIPTDEKWKETLQALSQEVQRQEKAATPSAGGSLLVEVSGAVVKPGVYRLTSLDRVADALQKAGGLHADANKTYVQKQLALASKLSDQQKIYIPFEGEGVEVLPTQSPVMATNGEKKSLNQATQKELEALEGIGEKRALTLLESMPYVSWDDVKSRAEIPESTVTVLQGKYTIEMY